MINYHCETCGGYKQTHSKGTGGNLCTCDPPTVSITEQTEYQKRLEKWRVHLNIMDLAKGFPKKRK